MILVSRMEPERFAREYGVRCLRIEPWKAVASPPFGSMWSLLAPGEHSTRHNHHEPETFFVFRGAGRISVGDERRDVQAGDVVYVPPFSGHTLENTSASDDLLVLGLFWEDMALVRRLDGRTESAPRRRVLVTATPPTVNGDLHLGHIAGPYLAADVYTRHQRMRGAEVWYLSGADDHQSYVAVKAWALGTSPRETADRFTARIEASLGACGIRPDLFARPAASRHHRAFVQQALSRLLESGDVVRRQAPSLWCDACDLELFEAHVAGVCPHCGRGSDGSACEACGRPNDCIDLGDARCKRCGGAPSVRSIERLYLRLAPREAALRAWYETLELPPHLAALCEAMLRDGLPDVAVSHVADWGIPVPVPGLERQRVYVWFEMALGYLAATQDLLERQSPDADWRRVWQSDDVEVVQFFGFDNGWFHAVLFPAVWTACHPELRLPKAFVTNEFYLLDGEKFSTSRGHAVWVEDFARCESIDAARFYLSLDRPEERQTSFTMGEYRSAVAHELAGRWQSWLAGLGARVAEEFEGRAPGTGAYTAVHRGFLKRLQALVGEMEEALDARTFSSARAARLLCDLVDAARRFAAAEAHLAGAPERHDLRRTAVALELLAARTLAMLATPIMPGFAGRLWQALGCGAAEPGCTRWESDLTFLPGGQAVRGLRDLVVVEPREEPSCRTAR